MGNALTLEKLEKQVENGTIDTVLVAFPDCLGRLMGKRVTGDYFIKHIAKHGVHACDYLLSVDMDMNPLSGFNMASWDKGYGDFHGVLDVNTLRPIPWLDGTAMVLVDLEWEDGSPVEESPRAILRKQIERAQKAGLYTMMGSELEFFLFDETHEELVQKNFQSPKPASDYRIDYHILQTSRDEFVIRDIRNAMCQANIPIEFSKGEWGKGQHEINLEYAEALEMADRHVIYKNGVKEIAWTNGCAATFMAKFSTEEAGSSFHLHTSVVDDKGKKNLFWDKKDQEGSQLFRQFLGGLLKYSKDLFLFFASTVNAYKRYQADSFAPTSIVWSADNRTAGFRVIGHGGSYRIENRMPGADANPYLAYAATIAAGLAGIEEGLDCGDAYSGDAYRDDSLMHVPKSLLAAADAFKNNELAHQAFGSAVVEHYAHHAVLEQQAFDAVVTRWEQERYFDRI